MKNSQTLREKNLGIYGFPEPSNGCNELLYFPRFTHTYVDHQVGLGQDVVNIKYFKWEKR